MSNAVSWINRIVRFNESESAIPVIAQDGRIIYVPWGVRHCEASHPFPKGACARLESIREGKWRRLNPRPVRIPVRSFSERCADDRCNYWFDLPPGHAIQGLYAPAAPGEETGRVYVVTVDLAVAVRYGYLPQFPLPDGGMAVVHDRWPKIVPSEPVLIPA